MDARTNLDNHDAAESDGPWAPLTRRIIGCAMQVHSTLGPGLLERLYEEALCIEMRNAGLQFEQQRAFRVDYKGIALSEQRLDLVVDNTVIVELKAVSAVTDLHLAQLVSYLRAARLPIGLLVNFHVARLKDGIYRRLNTPPVLPRREIAHPLSVTSVPSVFKSS